MTKTIDMHTHVLADATVKLMQKEIPSLGLKMAPYDADNAVCEVAGVAYRPFPRGGHDIERRFKDMDAAEVDVHLLSVAPQTWLYGQEAAVGVTASAIQNDEIARHVKEHPERFSGIATLPMQAPDKAADELRRAMRKLGLHGAMIGSNIGGKNLDDPSFEPLWAAAEELDAFMMIHPGNVAGADRLRSYYLGNLIGNPLDTTIAGACLIFGGVLERHPKLNFIMSHGGGFIPYQGGRWVHGWEVRPEPKVHVEAFAGAVSRPLPLRHHFARPGAAGISHFLGRRKSGVPRQRLPLRHGHGRMRAAGACGEHLRGRSRHYSRRSCGEDLEQEATGMKPGMN